MTAFRKFTMPYEAADSCGGARRAYRELFGRDYPHDDDLIRELAREIKTERQAAQWRTAKTKNEMTVHEELLRAMREDDETKTEGAPQ